MHGLRRVLRSLLKSLVFRAALMILSIFMEREAALAFGTHLLEE